MPDAWRVAAMGREAAPQKGTFREWRCAGDIPKSCLVTDGSRCIGANQARKLGAADPMAASEKARQTNLRIGGLTRLAAPGRQDSLVTGSYLVSELRGSYSTANLKGSISGQCPLETTIYWNSNDWSAANCCPSGHSGYLVGNFVVIVENLSHHVARLHKIKLFQPVQLFPNSAPSFFMIFNQRPQPRLVLLAIKPAL
jgi:hypothetical protein